MKPSERLQELARKRLRFVSLGSARWEALLTYLDERETLIHPIARVNAHSPGPAGSAATNGDMAEAPPMDVPLAVSLGKPGGLGEDLLAERAELRRQYYAERMNDYDAAEYASGGPVQREGFPTHERVQEWRREDAACRAKERAAREATLPMPIYATPGVALRPGVYEVVKLHSCDDAPVLQIGDRFGVGASLESVKNMVGGSYWQIVTYSEEAKHGESTWVSAARRVEPVHPVVKSSPSEDNCSQSKSLQEQVYALQDRLFECDEDDSRRLRLMREVIDDKIGWDDEEQQEAGDYLARLTQIADELPDLREAKRRAMYADSDVKQARAVRDKALGVVEVARALELIDPKEGPALLEAIENLAKAVKAYDWEEIPF